MALKRLEKKEGIKCRNSGYSLKITEDFQVRKIEPKRWLVQDNV